MIAVGVACVLGGFYTVPLDSGLHLIMINSNLWYYHDDKTANLTDPAGQFLWLENVLKDAGDHGNLVSCCTPTASLAAFDSQLLLIVVRVINLKNMISCSAASDAQSIIIVTMMRSV